MAKEFLIELGTEELPPTQLRTLAEAFAANFEAELKGAELAHEGVKWFAAPRRLALKVAALADSQSDKVVEKRGPAVSAAFDAEGNQQKRLKAGHAVVASRLTKQSAWLQTKVNGYCSNKK